MHTLCIRYTLDPNRLSYFQTYVERELEAIRRAGGDVVGYWLPSDFAGPTNIGYGLIDFESLTAYERYREALGADPLHLRNSEELARSGVVLNMERTLLKRCNGHAQPR